MIYTIKEASGGKPRVVHFNRLTPDAGDNEDAQVREPGLPITERGVGRNTRGASRSVFGTRRILTGTLCGRRSEESST